MKNKNTETKPSGKPSDASPFSRRFVCPSLASAAIDYVDAMRNYSDEETAEALEIASRRLETAAMTYARINSENEKLYPCYAIHRKRHLQSTYGEESKWVTTDKRIKIMGKIGIFAMVCEEQGMPHVVEISEIIPLG